MTFLAPALLAATLVVLVRRAGTWPARRTASGLAGCAALAVAAMLDGPAETSLTAHVAEHQVLVLVAAPLLVASAPIRLVLAASGRSTRRAVARLLHHRAVRAMSHPGFGLLAFSAAMVAVHLPVAENAAQRDAVLHAAQHAALLWGALALWAPLVAADPLPSRTGPMTRFSVGLLAMTLMTVGGAVIATAPEPLYAAHPDLVDQQNAGGLLWKAGMVAALPALLMSAWSALAAEERRQRARDLHEGAPS